VEDYLTQIARHDVVYAEPPACWQDGLLLGNGALGALFFAPAALQWIVNKTDVLDARTKSVRRIIAPDEARRMARSGAAVADFDREEFADGAPEGAGPKSCCQLSMELGYSNFGAGHPALPQIASRRPSPMRRCAWPWTSTCSIRGWNPTWTRTPTPSPSA
jgi:hypothetical protein